jgi:hypothetical protein
MMLSPEAIVEQQNLLATHRRTLAIYLQQIAESGTAHSPPSLLHGITETRNNIDRIKGILRAASVEVEDYPDDDIPSRPPYPKPNVGAGTKASRSQISLGERVRSLPWLAIGLGALIIAIAGVVIAVVPGIVSGNIQNTRSQISLAVALQTYHGRYVTAMDNGGTWDWVLRAETRKLSDWEKLTLFCLDDGKVAFQTYHGRYVTAMDNGGTWDWVLRAEAQKLSDWEKFTLVNAANGRNLPCSEAVKLLGQGGVSIALQTYHGRYVTAMDNGGTWDWVIRAETQKLSGWEKLRIILP